MRRVGDESPVRAIGAEVELFKYGLADQHLVAWDKRFFEGIATEDVEHDRTCNQGRKSWNAILVPNADIA